MPTHAHLHADPGPLTPASGWTDTEVSVRLRRSASGIVRAEGVLCRAPVWFRWDGATLWLVGSGASPVGEDRIRVHVDVGPGVTATVRSVAATVVYAARGNGTQWDTELHVADGARLDWRPEPVILTRHAHHEATTTVHAASGADVTLDEVLVLGRAGESAGVLCSTLVARIDDVPVLRTSLDTSVPGWSGPAGVDGASVVGTRVRLRPGIDVPEPDAPSRPTDRIDPAGTDAPDDHRTAVLEPTAGCQIAVTTATDAAEARRAIDVALPR